jgi:short-subunit dehydrogenase
MVEEESYAVVTGAGQGLGKSFARALAERKLNVLLVSLKGEDLSGYCSELHKEYGISAKYYEADLTDMVQLSSLADWIQQNFKVSVLINNAGLGRSGEFLDSDLNHVDQMILLNVRTTTWLTHKLMPLLLQNKNSYILNVSSMASFQPIPFKTVYSASKVYIEYFSKGLFLEYRSRGLHISSLHPGPMKTNDEVRERIRRQSWFGLLGLKTTESVASSAIGKMFRKSPMIIIGGGNQFHFILLKLLPPWLRNHLLLYGLKKELKGQG